MSDRLEVVPGPGAVIRAGTITVWIGPTASAPLLDFLVRAAQQAPRTPGAAQSLAEHILGVLRSGDPERAAPFAVVGGGGGGLVALLHGPVQLWDGTRLLTPNPNPGWLAASLGIPPMATVGPVGAPTRAPAGSVFDLRDGVVPGAGFCLAPDPRGFTFSTSDPRPGAVTSDPRATITPTGSNPGPLAPVSPSPATGAPWAPVNQPVRSEQPVRSDQLVRSDQPAGAAPVPTSPGTTPAPVASPDLPGGWGPIPPPAGSGPVAIPPPPARSPHVARSDPASHAEWPTGAFSNPAPLPGGGLSASPLPAGAESQVPPPPPPPPPGAVAAGELASPASERPIVVRSPAVSSPNRVDVDRRPAPTETIDLRGHSQAPGDPLPNAAGAAVATVGATMVSGVRCARNHFNHPFSSSCVRCGAAIPETPRYPSDGPRPPLGVLVRDDSTVFSVDGSYVLGSGPEGDPAVISGQARPLRLSGPATEEVSAVHAEVRCQNWDVTLIDRGSEYGTFVLRPGETDWERLAPYQVHVLTPGTHLACGQRILTYASPWPASA